MQPAGTGPRPKSHPAGTAGLVLSLCSLVPLPLVGGLAGSLLGAIGLRAARREPHRWSAGSANAAVVIGLLLGSVPALLFGIVKADDWTWLPFAVVLLHAAVVVGVAYGARNAVPGSMGVLAGAGLVLAMALGLVAFVIFLGEVFWDAVFSGDP